MGLVRRCDWRITYQEYPTVFSTSARGVPARRVARDAEVTVNMAFALPAVGEVATRIVVPRRTPDFDGLKHRFAEQDAILLCLENPKIGRIDHPEIIGDRIAESGPIFWHFLAQEMENGITEVVVGRVAPIVCHVFMHQAP
jgi:hypothetical protein